MLKRLWRLLRPVLLPTAALILFVEEWGWRPLAAWAARWARWPPIAWVEARVRRARPKVALALFFVPAVALFPVKLFALWLIHLGHPWLGLAVIAAAKLLGTALVGRLFLLTEPQLMRFTWFVRGMSWWRVTRQRVLLAVRSSAGWRQLRRWRAGIRAWWRWLRRE